MIKRFFILGVASFGLIFCQQAPTKIATEEGVVVDKAFAKLVTNNTVVFDTRSTFDFNLSKIPGSINLPVADFEVEKDSLDAAKRLALYGVTLETPVLIVGTGDQGKLAWEFVKLGLRKIETLNIETFRTLNLRSEPSKRNVPLWKPSEKNGEISQKEFIQKLEKIKPTPMTGARSAALGGAPSGVFNDRVLVVVPNGQWSQKQAYPFIFEKNFSEKNLFDTKGFLKLNSDWSDSLKRYDVVFLLDSSKESAERAYALSAWGAKSIWVVK